MTQFAQESAPLARLPLMIYQQDNNARGVILELPYS